MQVTKHTDDFATAPQLAPEHMTAIAAHGFKTVINNRPDMDGGHAQPQRKCKLLPRRLA